MPTQQQQLDDAFAAYLDELRAWALGAVVAAYATADPAYVSTSFASIVPIVTGIYETTTIFAQDATDEYLTLKAALDALPIRWDWSLGRPDAPRLLPSGADAPVHFARAPWGVQSLIGQGMDPQEAIDASRARAIRAIGSQPHYVARQVTADRTFAVNAAGGLRLTDSGVTTPRDVSSSWLDELERFANAGPAPRLVLDASSRISGVLASMRWRRVPSPGACSFCLTLASRGAVYITAESAVTVGSPHSKRRRSRRLTPMVDGGPFHDNCRCRAVADYVGLPPMLVPSEDFRRLTERDADGNLPQFGIGRTRYTLSSFDFGVYDGPVDLFHPPKPSWATPSPA